MFLDWLDSLDTDTLVFLFVLAIFTPFVIWAVVAHRASKREESQRQATYQADFSQRARELGISEDELRRRTQGMNGAEAVEYLMTDRDRFFASRGLLTGHIFSNFKAVRPGHRAFTCRGVYACCAVVLLVLFASYALGELYDYTQYQAVASVIEGGDANAAYSASTDYENEVSGVLMAVSIPLLLLGILSGALLADEHGWWLSRTPLMVAIGLCLPAAIGTFSSMVPLHTLDDHYSVFHVGYDDMEVLGQYGWVVLLGLVVVLAFVVPALRYAWVRRYPQGSQERRVPAGGFVVRAVLLCLLPIALLYVIGGDGNPIVQIALCVLGGVIGVRSLFNVYDLCDWAEATHVDAAYEWDAAFYIMLLATFSVFSFNEAAQKADDMRKGR